MAEPKDVEFQEFVKRQREIAKEAAENEQAFDPKAQLDEWLEYLSKLYKDISSYLADYTGDQSIRLEYKSVQITEEFSGTYDAKALIIHIGLKKIRFNPIGTMLIGSKGRVDVVGPAGTSRLVLINKRLERPGQMVRVTIGGARTEPEQKPEPKKIEWAWKIISRPPAIAFIDLNKETFLRLLLEVSNG